MKLVKATPSEVAKYYPDDDARAIMRAQEILQDPKRKKDALVELKKQAEAANAAMVHAKAVGDVKVELKNVFGGK